MLASTTKSFRALLPALGLMLFAAAPALSRDTLWWKSGAVQHGIVLDSNDGELKFRLWNQGKLESETSIPKSEITTFHRCVLPTRLESLNPTQLDDYQTYAEELVPQAADPIARELCIRLTLIVAYHADRDSANREWAFETLPKLGRNNQETRVLGLLRDMELNSVTRSASEDSQASIPSSKRNEVRELLRMIRAGKEQAALSKINSLRKSDYPSEWNRVFSLDDLALLAQRSTLEPRALLQLLEFDRMIESQASSGLPLRSSDWSAQSQSGFRGWDRIPDLKNVTEFDPAKSLYRNGRWIRPAK